MKILHVSDHLPGYHKVWGGAEQVAFRYIKLLSEENGNVVVCGVKSEKPVEEDFVYRSVRVLEDFFPEKYQVYVTGLKNRIISFDVLSFFHMLWILNREKPDVVHFHKFNKISFSAVLAAKIARAKIVLGIYDYWYLCPGGMLIDDKGNLCKRFHGPWCAKCDAVKDFRFLLPMISPIRKPIFNFFYRFVDGFFVLSKAQGKLLENYGFHTNKIYLVRQVFNFPKKINTKKIKNNVILFAGWIDYRKGLHIIIDALSDILKDYPKTKLWVLKLESIPAYEKVINKKIKQLKLQRYIQFYGRLTKEGFQNLLQQANVVIVPEQWENMSPVVVVEAMANEKVVVASKIGGIPEFIKDGINGFLANHNDPSQFAQKVVLALKNEKLSNRLRQQAAIDIAEICNSNTIRRNLLKLYSTYEKPN